jgi:carbon-monoxide dehydrogenase medium subunit
MYPFNYVRPTSVAEAVAALDGGNFLSGGMTLLPSLKMRLARPETLVDLAGIAELTGIKVESGSISIGAMTRHSEVARSADVQRELPALAELAGGIGDPLVRNRGTIGGSIANSDPSADYPAAVVGLGATIVTDRREISADKFFTGLFATALQPGELVTRIRFPIVRRAAYAKFPSPASRYAMVGVMVVDTGKGVRVAVTGAGPCVFRLATFEAALDKQFAPQAIDGLAVSADGLNQDLHGTPEYRANLISVMTRRAVTAVQARG